MRTIPDAVALQDGVAMRGINERVANAGSRVGAQAC